MCRRGTLRALPAVALLLGALASALAAQFPVHHPVPGGVAVVELGVGADAEFIARFGRTPIMVVDDGGTLYGVVGIGLDTPLGNYVVTIHTAEDETRTREFTVSPFSYPFKTERRVGRPPPLRAAGAWRADLDADLPLVYPVAAASLEPFGTRYVEEESIVPAKYVILRVDADTDVAAPGGGVVADLVDDDAGATYVTIDHGMGLFSTVGPVTRPRRQAGEPVAGGEVIGRFERGASADVPLHWAVMLSGANVNPLLFTAGFTLPDDAGQPR